MQQDKQTSYVIPALMVAVIAVSFSAVLVRLSAAPPLVIAAYRLLFTTVLLAPPAFYYHKEELKRLTGRDIFLSVLSGIFLAVHFFSWIASLQYTTVAASVLIVSLHPIIVALLGRYLLGEKIEGAYWFGLVLAILGIGVMGVGDLLAGAGSWPGGLLALLGAVTMAAYLLVGRTLRQSISTLTYTLWVYGSAASALLVVSFLTSTPLYPFSGREYILFLSMALVPTIMGHTVLNWALGKVPTYYVSLAVLGEPVGAGLLALLILKETPGISQLMGGVLILLGLYFAVRSNERGKGLLS